MSWSRTLLKNTFLSGKIWEKKKTSDVVNIISEGKNLYDVEHVLAISIYS